MNSNSLIIKISATETESETTEINYTAVYTGDYKKQIFESFFDAFTTDQMNFNSVVEFNNLWEDQNAEFIGIKRNPKKENEPLTDSDIEEYNSMMDDEFSFIKPIIDEELVDVIKNTSSKVVMIYNKLKTVIIPELNELGIASDIVPLPRSSKGYYFEDYRGSYLVTIHGEHFFEHPQIIFTIYLDEDGKNIDLSQNVRVTFTHMDEETKKTILGLFHKELPNHYEWSGNNDEIMLIYYDARNSKNKY
jgi:hypothetical protein